MSPPSEEETWLLSLREWRRKTRDRTPKGGDNVNLDISTSTRANPRVSTLARQNTSAEADPSEAVRLLLLRHHQGVDGCEGSLFRLVGAVDLLGLDDLETTQVGYQ